MTISIKLCTEFGFGRSASTSLLLEHRAAAVGGSAGGVDVGGDTGTDGSLDHPPSSTD